MLFACVSFSCPSLLLLLLQRCAVHITELTLRGFGTTPYITISTIYNKGILQIEYSLYKKTVFVLGQRQVQ